jgi:hypothetical protein
MKAHSEGAISSVPDPNRPKQTWWNRPSRPQRKAYSKRMAALAEAERREAEGGAKGPAEADGKAGAQVAAGRDDYVGANGDDYVGAGRDDCAGANGDDSGGAELGAVGHADIGTGAVTETPRTPEAEA